VYTLTNYRLILTISDLEQKETSRALFTTFFLSKYQQGASYCRLHLLRQLSYIWCFVIYLSTYLNQDSGETSLLVFNQAVVYSVK